MPDLNNTKDGGGNAATKTRQSPKAAELLAEKINGLLVWIRNTAHVNFYSGLRRNSPRIRMRSAAQIKAFNETLQLLLIAFVMVFKDWPTRLVTIIALILIRRHGSGK
ncbi:MAG: hypothetical protein ABSB84_04045 [Verrucomicrobiota bacterium]|jgi:hypothetical protein